MDFMLKVSAWARSVGKKSALFCTCGDRAKDTEGVQCIGLRMGIGPIHWTPSYKIGAVTLFFFFFFFFC